MQILKGILFLAALLAIEFVAVVVIMLIFRGAQR